ncbi:MAG: trigger factor [Butyrivibrio sp.]|nr:trigger factor [Butyrivibrio sp.]
MKKNLTLFVAFVSAAALLTACGDKANDNSSEEASAVATEAADAESATQTGTDVDLSTLETQTLLDTDLETCLTLGEYKGVTAEVTTVEITDEDVESKLASVYAQDPMMVDVTDRAVESGDTVNIDYVGKYADTQEAFQGGTAQGASLTIGSHSYIDGFEDGLIGVNIGDTVDLNLTFPENYGAAELAGKDVVFTVTVNGIQTAEAEPSDEWVASKNLEGVTDLEGFKNHLKEQLTQDAQSTREDTIQNTVLETVMNNTTFNEIPEKLYNRYYKQQYEAINYYTQLYAASTGTQLTADEFVTMTMQNNGIAGEAQDYIKNMVDQTTKQFMMLQAIADKEGIEVTDEDIDEYLHNAYDNAATTAYSTFEEYKASLEMEIYREGLMSQKVVDFLTENANVVETN